MLSGKMRARHSYIAVWPNLKILPCKDALQAVSLALNIALRFYGGLVQCLSNVATASKLLIQLEMARGNLSSTIEAEQKDSDISSGTHLWWSFVMSSPS